MPSPDASDQRSAPQPACDTTNQEIATSIMGWIRRAALGDPLVPYEQRVDKALQRIQASKPWTKSKRDWLLRITT